MCAEAGHRADLIGARVGNVDDACRLLGLQIRDEGSLEGLGLAHDVLLVTATGQSQQQTVIRLHLGNRKLSVIGGPPHKTAQEEACPTQVIRLLNPHLYDDPEGHLYIC